MEDTLLNSSTGKSATGLRIASKILQLEMAIRNFGVELEYRCDFQTLREISNDIPDTPELTGVFDNRYCDIGTENGFWIKAADHDGQIIHIQAIRHDDLSGTNLSRHWLDNPLLYAPAGYDIAIDKSDFETAPAANKITGRVCYLGDYWLEQSYRNMEFAPLLSEYGKLQALMRFSPDFLYAFMQQRMVERGWAARAGFLHIHPWAPRWQIRGKAKFYDEYFVWISGPELENLWAASKRDIDILSRINVTGNGRSPVEKSITG